MGRQLILLVSSIAIVVVFPQPAASISRGDVDICDAPLQPAKSKLITPPILEAGSNPYVKAFVPLLPVSTADPAGDWNGEFIVTTVCSVLQQILGCFDETGDADGCTAPHEQNAATLPQPCTSMNPERSSASGDWVGVDPTGLRVGAFVPTSPPDAEGYFAGLRLEAWVC